MNDDTLTNEFIEENFKEENKVYNWLNLDNLGNIVIDKITKKFWIELTASTSTLPKYVFKFIEKWCNKKGYEYLYN